MIDIKSLGIWLSTKCPVKISSLILITFIECNSVHTAMYLLVWMCVMFKVFISFVPCHPLLSFHHSISWTFTCGYSEISSSSSSSLLVSPICHTLLHWNVSTRLCSSWFPTCTCTQPANMIITIIGYQQYHDCTSKKSNLMPHYSVVHLLAFQLLLVDFKVLTALTLRTDLHNLGHSQLHRATNIANLCISAHVWPLQ